MWGLKIKTCTQILHRGYRSRDIAHAQWRFALVRHFGAEYNEKRLEIHTWSQWRTNRKWVREVEWSHDRWSRVNPKGQGRVPIVWRLIFRKRLEIHTWSQWRTNRKWGMWVTWPMTSRDPKRSRSWPRYRKIQISQKQWEIEVQY